MIVFMYRGIMESRKKTQSADLDRKAQDQGMGMNLRVLAREERFTSVAMRV